MTRKHFRIMADNIAAIENRAYRRECAQETAAMCAKANRRFDRARFMAACGC